MIVCVFGVMIDVFLEGELFDECSVVEIVLEWVMKG